jgi:predicted CopG family antitoxin
MLFNFIFFFCRTENFLTIDTYTTPMTNTTIQISKELLEMLKERKMYDNESYEDVIRDLLEDTMELSEQTMLNIKKSEQDIKHSRVKTLKEVEKRLGL